MAEHVPEIKESKFNRQRASTETMRGNCTTGYTFTQGEGAAGQSQYHHVLPIETLQDGSIDPQGKLDFFHKCMALTEWDINKGSNLIGLPTKDIYLANDRSHADESHLGKPATSWLTQLRNVASEFGMFGVLPDLPCHQVEHNMYNEEVIKYLKRQIWQPLAKEQEACKVSGENFAGQLDSASSHWRQFLVDRGASHGGAAHCWMHRHDKGYDQFWYIPFSMNPGTPRKSKPPARAPSRKQSAWLSSLFT